MLIHVTVIVAPSNVLEYLNYRRVLSIGTLRVKDYSVSVPIGAKNALNARHHVVALLLGIRFG